MEYIAFDCHKHYTYAVVEDERGRIVREGRIPHERGALREFLSRCREGSPVAVETVGNWYWIVDEIEEAGFRPRLVHAGKAKLMLGMVNKTDKLDARGLNKLQRAGTLPEVWIPPGELRDMRELPRARMVLVRERTRLKQRVHATLAKYGIQVGASDLFGAKGRQLLWAKRPLLPLAPHPLRHQRAVAADRCLGRRDPGHRGEDEGGAFPHPGGEAFGDLARGRVYPGGGDPRWRWVM